MIVVVQDTTGYTLVQPTMGHRLLAQLRAPALDRVLASGTPPETDPLLAWRAHQLVRPAMRRGLARGLHRILQAATEPRPWMTAQVLPRRAQVRVAFDELADLADVLSAPSPLTAQGIAMTVIMLREPNSPVHSASSRIDLANHVRRILVVLDPLTL